MLLAGNVLRFTFVDGGHETKSLALKLMLVAHRLSFFSLDDDVSSSEGDVESSEDGAYSSVGDVYSRN